jgi:hypothetical protein
MRCCPAQQFPTFSASRIRPPHSSTMSKDGYATCLTFYSTISLEVQNLRLMKQSCSWEANSCSDSQDTVRFLMNPKVHYRLQKGPVLCQTSPNTHTLFLTINLNIVRFQVLTVASMKFTVFWDVEACSPVEVDLTTRRYIPEDSKIQYYYFPHTYTYVSTQSLTHG